MNPFTRQAGLTVLLLPIMFGLWYAGGQLLAAPAVWLTDFILSHVFSNAVDRAFLDGTNMTVVTWFGEINGQITSAEAAGYQLALNINTRLISYSMPFYAALLWASNVDNTLERFARGLIIIWAAMTLGLIAIAAKDLMIVVGPLFIEQTLVPHPNVIGVLYQFNVLLAPSLVPVALWVWQLRGSALWDKLQNELFASLPKD